MIKAPFAEIGSISLEDAVAQTPKLVNPDGDLVTAARGLGIVFGDE